MKKARPLRAALATLTLTTATLTLTAVTPPDTAWGAPTSTEDTGWGTPPTDPEEPPAAPLDTAWG